ncbi:histidinol-phosphate aminotransferase [Planctomycetaceae bacterium]|nr:histidinol-phosphate aminotransferase [Planctomycetaceae bacterium]
MRGTLSFLKPQLREGVGSYKLDVPPCPIKLTQNENPYDWPASLKQTVFERVRDLSWNRYPPFVPADFVAQVAKYVGVDARQVLVGNGSNELMYAAFACVLGPGRKLVITQPTFTLYALLGNVFGAEVVDVPLDAEMRFDLPAIAKAARDAACVVIASPNNPTGSVIDLMELEHLIAGSEALFIVDEAYFDFHGVSALELTRTHRNVVVLRTFSKAFATAGLRFGFMVAHEEVQPYFATAKLPYNVNIFTMAAVEVALENAGVLKGRLDEIKRERERVIRVLGEMGLRVFPSRANFVLFESAKPARKLWDSMVKRGVLTRDVSKYPRLERALRVSIGRPEENDAFLKALEAALAEVKS